MEPLIRFYSISVLGQINSMAVEFTDANGKVTSLAFDTRPIPDEKQPGKNDFAIFRDCPIIDHTNTQRVMMNSRQTLKVLRDELNAMAL